MTERPTFGDAVLLLAQLAARYESGDTFVTRSEVEMARDDVDAAAKRLIRRTALDGEHL